MHVHTPKSLQLREEAFQKEARSRRRLGSTSLPMLTSAKNYKTKEHFLHKRPLSLKNASAPSSSIGCEVNSAKKVLLATRDSEQLQSRWPTNSKEPDTCPRAPVLPHLLRKLSKARGMNDLTTSFHRVGQRAPQAADHKYQKSHRKI